MEAKADIIHLTYLSEAYCKVLKAYEGQDPLLFYPSKSKTTVAVPVTEIVPLYQWLQKVFAEGWMDETGKRRGGITKISQRLLWMLERHLLLIPPETVLKKKPRPRTVQGHTIQMPTQTYGYLYFIFNWVDGKPFEIFAYIGKNGSDHQATAEGVCRLASLAFRYGIDATEVADQLRGIQSSTPEWFGGEQIKSLEDAVSKAIKQGLELGDPSSQKEESIL